MRRRVLLVLSVWSLASSSCGPDGVAGFACRADKTCDEGLTCVPLPGKSLLNGRDRDVCLEVPRPPVRLRATTTPCCVDQYLVRDESGGLRIGDAEEREPLEFNLASYVDEGVTLTTTTEDDIGDEHLFALCVGRDPGGRVELCDTEDEVFDEEEENRLQPLPAALWAEVSPALDGNPAHVSFRSAENGGFLRHASSEIFAQSDSGPPFNEDASWILEPVDEPPSPSNEQIPVTACGAVLTATGADYRLANDLDCPAGEAVTINGADINFSFDGHTIASTDASVVVLNSTNVRVHGPGTATGSQDSGIVINGGVGNQVDNLTLTANRVGVATIFAPANTVVINCTIEPRGGDGEGIQLIEGDAEARQNVITGGAIGVHVFGASQGNQLVGNTIGGGAFGIVVDDGSGSNIISANTVDSSSTDLIDNNDACGSNTWSGNSFSTASPSDCIQ